MKKMRKNKQNMERSDQVEICKWYIYSYCRFISIWTLFHCLLLYTITVTL